jgi:hypothetical protein
MASNGEHTTHYTLYCSVVEPDKNPSLGAFEKSLIIDQMSFFIISHHRVICECKRILGLSKARGAACVREKAQEKEPEGERERFLGLSFIFYAHTTIYACLSKSLMQQSATH